MELAVAATYNRHHIFREYPVSSLHTCCDIEHARLSLNQISELLQRNEEGVAHAAILHLERRLRDGEALSIAPLLPPNLFAMLPESQLILAALSVDGFAVPLGAAPHTLPPAVRLAWLRAWLLEHPPTLPAYEQTPMVWEALSALPPERVIRTGLIGHMVSSADTNVRGRCVAYLRTGVDAGLLPRVQAHELATMLAQDVRESIAIDALHLLGAPWAHGLPITEISLRHQTLDVCLAWVALLHARGETLRIRQLFAAHDELGVLTVRLLEALGELGDGADIASIIDAIRHDGHGCGQAGLSALVALKRRGFSPEEEHVRSLVDAFLHGSALNAAAMAEVLSSRADLVVAEVDALDPSAVPWSRAVDMLEALGTKKAVGRLEIIVKREAERAGWWHAIRALGRLGAGNVEGVILTQLDAEPDACLFALHYIGGEQTVQHLTQRMAEPGCLPVWIAAAADLLFQLAPGAELFDLLASRNLLNDKVLGALPAHGVVAQSRVFRDILFQTAHPLRLLAIGAAGRTGGPLAVEALGDLIADPDEEVRAAALGALRTLGFRLKNEGAIRPPNLACADDPGGALVADVILRRLRDKSTELEATAHLLDALAGLGHPGLVPVVRPYLRQNLPDIRKRAITCLSVAGPAAAPWLLRWLADDDTTLSRQVLLALARLPARGLASQIAARLDAPNMNIKKTAAEALAAVGDVSAVSKLLHWLAVHDNPGFRDLLIQALKKILGNWYRSVLVERLATTTGRHSQNLLIDALSGTLSATDVAAIVAVRVPETPLGTHWSVALLDSIYAGDFSLREATLPDMDRELRRRGLGGRIPVAHLTSERDNAKAWQASALRAGEQLKFALRAPLVRKDEIATLLALLRKANVTRPILSSALSRGEISTLLDLYPQLPHDASAGAWQLLAQAPLDPVSRVRVARLIDDMPAHEIPANLLLGSAETMTTALARTVTHRPEAGVGEAALRVLILANEVKPEQWPGAHAQLLVAHFVRTGAMEEGLAWCRQRNQIPLLLRTMRDIHGAALTLGHMQRWADIHPDGLPVMVPAMTAFGPDASGLLVRIATMARLAMNVREQALTELGQRSPAAAPLKLWLDFLQVEHANLREIAAKMLLQSGEPGHRATVLAAFLEGRFREHFSISLNSDDLPFLQRATTHAQSAVRLRLVRLIEAWHDPRKTALLLRLWETEDMELKARCRDVLRHLDPHVVLPFVQEAIDEGQLEILDVVGTTASVPPWVVDKFQAGDAAWERFFGRMAAGGVLHAPGLADRLVRMLAKGDANGNLIALLMRLSDWSDPGKQPSLVAALGPFLGDKRRQETLSQVVLATRALNLAARVHILVNVGKPSDPTIAAALADAVLENAALRSLLPEPMRIAADRDMMGSLHGEPERVRRIFTYRAATAKAERAAVVDMLERGLSHGSLRVRLHAHRLLRTHAEGARYLAATAQLLREKDAATVRSAIRTLTYGRHVDSIAEIIELLFHRDATVRQTARDGLIHLGPAALPQLTKAIGNARPDRRDTYAAIVESIRQGLSSNENSDQGEA